MTEFRQGHSSVFISSSHKILTCGGQWRGKVHSSCEFFDLSSKTSALADFEMRKARTNFAAAFHRGFLYLLGGQTKFGYTKTIEKIDLTSGKVDEM